MAGRRKRSDKGVGSNQYQDKPQEHSDDEIAEVQAKSSSLRGKGGATAGLAADIMDFEPVDFLPSSIETDFSNVDFSEYNEPVNLSWEDVRKGGTPRGGTDFRKMEFQEVDRVPLEMNHALVKGLPENGTEFKPMVDGSITINEEIDSKIDRLMEVGEGAMKNLTDDFVKKFKLDPKALEFYTHSSREEAVADLGEKAWINGGVVAAGMNPDTKGEHVDVLVNTKNGPIGVIAVPVLRNESTGEYDVKFFTEEMMSGNIVELKNQNDVNFHAKTYNEE